MRKTKITEMRIVDPMAALVLTANDYKDPTDIMREAATCTDIERFRTLCSQFMNLEARNQVVKKNVSQLNAITAGILNETEVDDCFTLDDCERSLGRYGTNYIITVLRDLVQKGILKKVKFRVPNTYYKYRSAYVRIK